MCCSIFLAAVDQPQAIIGSIRQLKEDIDRDLRDALRMITVIPLIGLIVAALGAGNLMMANVVMRIRQIALLRAIGASKGQIIRLVMAEAVILGLVGVTLGFLLGVHDSHNAQMLTCTSSGASKPTLDYSVGNGCTGAGCDSRNMFDSRLASQPGWQRRAISSPPCPPSKAWWVDKPSPTEPV